MALALAGVGLRPEKCRGCKIRKNLQIWKT